MGCCFYAAAAAAIVVDLIVLVTGYLDFLSHVELVIVAETSRNSVAERPKNDGQEN